MKLFALRKCVFRSGKGKNPESMVENEKKNHENDWKIQYGRLSGFLRKQNVKKSALEWMEASSS